MENKAVARPATHNALQCGARDSTTAEHLPGAREVSAACFEPDSKRPLLYLALSRS